LIAEELIIPFDMLLAEGLKIPTLLAEGLKIPTRYIFFVCAKLC